jgi:hypothetical protein
MKFILVLMSFAIAAIMMTACGGNVGPPVGDRVSSAPDAYGLNDNANKFDGSYFNNYAGRAPYYYAPWLPPTNANFDELAAYNATYLAANPGADSHWAWPYRTTRVLMKWNDAWPGPGGWITNHMWDSYQDGDQWYNWESFTKIVYDLDAEIPIWGSYGIIQDLYNDPHAGYHGNIPVPGPNGFGPY